MTTFCWIGRQAHDPRLVDRARQRLLAIDVFAQLHGRHRGHRVGIVGRADHHGVDLAVQLVEHLAEIDIPLSVRELPVRIFRPALVHVAQRHEVLAGQLAGVRLALTAGPDDGDVQLLVGRVGPDGTTVLEDHHPGGPEGRSLDELASIEVGWHGTAHGGEKEDGRVWRDGTRV